MRKFSRFYKATYIVPIFLMILGCDEFIKNVLEPQIVLEPQVLYTEIEVALKNTDPKTLEIRIPFDKKVYVRGKPNLLINFVSQKQIAYAAYTEGDGTTTLTFVYKYEKDGAIKLRKGERISLGAFLLENGKISSKDDFVIDFVLNREVVVKQPETRIRKRWLPEAVKESLVRKQPETTPEEDTSPSSQCISPRVVDNKGKVSPYNYARIQERKKNVVLIGFDFRRDVSPVVGKPTISLTVHGVPRTATYERNYKNTRMLLFKYTLTEDEVFHCPIEMKVLENSLQFNKGEIVFVGDSGTEVPKTHKAQYIDVELEEYAPSFSLEEISSPKNAKIYQRGERIKIKVTFNQSVSENQKSLLKEGLTVTPLTLNFDSKNPQNSDRTYFYKVKLRDPREFPISSEQVISGIDFINNVRIRASWGGVPAILISEK